MISALFQEPKVEFEQVGGKKRGPKKGTKKGKKGSKGKKGKKTRRRRTKKH